MDCSSPGSSVHGIFPARILEWVAISYSRGSSPPGGWTQVSCIAGQVFTIWATREALGLWCTITIPPGAPLLLFVRDWSQPRWSSYKSLRTMLCVCLWMWIGKWWCDFLKAALLGITVCVCVCVCVIPFITESTCIMVKWVEMMDFWQSQAHSIMAPWCWGHGTTTSLCRWLTEREIPITTETLVLFKSGLYCPQLLAYLYIKYL